MKKKKRIKMLGNVERGIFEQPDLSKSRKVEKYIKGIEDFIPKSQYERIEHQEKVIEDIVDNWITLSQNFKFHAIFATSSIPEAIKYYRLLKDKIKEVNLDLKITALFDPNIDNDDGASSSFKEDGLVEIIEDYNKRYEQDFTLKIFPKFKKDIASRLAHKKPYNFIERTPEKQIDLLIVVDQMLTGFDSKWINTLYLDKVLKYETIIQAFSRTNRLFGPDKPFGTIRYYRYPHTMEENINKAVKLYSGDKPLGLFADRLENNLKKLNRVFEDISELFKNSKIVNFEKLSDDLAERAEFAKLFKKFNEVLEASKIQGFNWDKLEHEFDEPEPKRIIKLNIDEDTYLVLVQRYKELPSSGGGSGGNTNIPFEIEGYITEIDTDKIDTDFMNSRFDKYRKIIVSGDPLEIEKTLNELHNSFSKLSQEEQKYANIFLHDIQNGDIKLEVDKTFREYISEYQANAENSEIMKLVDSLGIDAEKLKKMINNDVNELNIDNYGRFTDLKNTADKIKAKEYFEKLEGVKIMPLEVNMKIHNLLKEFILNNNF